MIPIWAMILLLFLGIASGITNGLFGFGGGFLIVPALYWIVRTLGAFPENICMKIAVGTSLMSLTINATNCVARLHAQGKIDYKRVIPYLPPISLGAMATLIASQELGGETIRKLFAAYLVVAIGLHIQKNRSEDKITDPTVPSWLQIYLFGMFTGFFASLLGVGGSVMTVPHFRKQGLEIKHCIPIAVTLALPVAVIGTTSYVWAGWGESTGYLYLPAVMPIILGGNFGIQIGIFLAKQIPNTYYVRCYIMLLTAVLIAMIV
ncbi:MAG: sulfite exporter TauE/SafE family protein [Myxococcota bacterium]